MEAQPFLGFCRQIRGRRRSSFPRPRLLAARFRPRTPAQLSVPEAEALSHRSLSTGSFACALFLIV